MPQPKGEDASATPAAAKKKKHTGADGEPEADEGESKSDIKADMHPSFPHVRFSRAPVMKFYCINHDALVEMGPSAGQYKAQFECLVKGCDGASCNSFYYSIRCLSVHRGRG